MINPSFILQFGSSKILETPCIEIDPKKINTPAIKKKIKYLILSLKKYRKITGLGRGLAANQIGLTEKMFVIYTDKKILVFINPKVIKKSLQQLVYPEMCMSAVPVAVKLIRPSWIEFEYLDEKGNKKIWDKKDHSKQTTLLNRVFQHEIDHLSGIVNITKARSAKDLIFVSDPDFFKTAKFENP